MNIGRIIFLRLIEILYFKIWKVSLKGVVLKNNCLNSIRNFLKFFYLLVFYFYWKVRGFLIVVKLIVFMFEIDFVIICI